MTSFDQIEQASLTDVGVRRSHNQDNFAVLLAADDEQWRKCGHFFLVADGMGGHAVGEKASEQATGVIPHTYQKHAQDGPRIALRKAFLEANATIHAFGEQNAEFRGTGTTSTALVLRPDGAWIGHVGDSRAYRIRNGLIEQLTYDHSIVWEIARLKRIPPSQVQEYSSNVILRCLGPQPLVQVDVEGPHPIVDGDIFLLCSDGLSGPIKNPAEIGAIASVLPPEEACRFLVDLANLFGGPDNITVLIARAGSSQPSNVPTTPPRLPGTSLWSRVPWPLLSLLGGSLLVAAAIGLRIAWGENAGALAVLFFLLAVPAIAAGVIGLVLHHKKQNDPDEDEPSEPRIHSRDACHVDRALVDNLAQREQSLRQYVLERQWETDLAEYEEHHTRAEQLLRENDLVGAFREFCRAMRPLNVTMTRYRSKEETFQPVWDK